mgnify:FL=1
MIDVQIYQASVGAQQKSPRYVPEHRREHECYERENIEETSAWRIGSVDNPGQHESYCYGHGR